MKLKGFTKASVFPVLIFVLMAFMSVVSFAEETTPTWKTVKDMSVTRAYLGTATVNGKIYAIGGEGEGAGGLNSVEEYNPLTDTWVNKSPMPTGRCAFATTVVDGKIYVIGGLKRYDPLHPFTSDYTNAVEVYDPSTDVWTNKSPMPIATELCSATSLDGKIYVVGGFSNNYSTNKVEVYDPQSDSWTTKNNFPYSLRSLQVVTINNKIYAIGGAKSGDSDLSNKVLEYNSTTDTWTEKRSMSTARADHSVVVSNGKVIVAGGAGPLNTVEEYDPTTDTWKNDSNMILARRGLGLSECNGSIYAIGGTNNVNSAAIYKSVEKLTINEQTNNPILTATASATKAKIGDEFTTDIAIHNVTNICAEDIKVSYDSNLFEYVGATAQTGLKIYKEDTSTPGTVRFIVACQGKDNVATGDKNLIQLKFKAKSRGVGKVDIIKGRIADNATLEMDVADENCGEATIEIGGKDVNRTDSFTLLDLGIDAYYFGFNAEDTDTTKYDADLDSNGKIDDGDLTSITESILLNKDYPLN